MTNKIIIEQNRGAIEADLYPYERKCWLLNLFLERMGQIDYPLNTVAEIASVLSTGLEKFVRSQIINNAPSLELAGGIKLSKSMLFDAVETPDLTECLSVERLLKQYYAVPFDALVFEHGKFSVSEEIRHKAIAQHTRYAETPRQTELYKDAIKLVAEINKFNKRYGPATGNRAWHHLADISNIMVWDGASETYRVNTTLILSGHLATQ